MLYSTLLHKERLHGQESSTALLSAPPMPPQTLRTETLYSAPESIATVVAERVPEDGAFDVVEDAVVEGA